MASESAARRKQDPPWKCIGWMCRVFGHKYNTVDYVNASDYCYRCGMPRGGWPNGR
jgi:hypothetical protein